MNSERIASELLYVEPPSFKIEEKIGLETILSCETGAFQNKQNSETWCDSTKEDGPHQTSGNQRDTCSACNPLTNAPYSIKSVLTGSEAREWRSLLKDKESTLQEVNITINFPQVLEIQSISVKAGKTPLPAVWALETTIDVKSDFQRVHYYVTNPEDCLKHFGVRLLDNGLDNPVCNLQPEGSWTESKTDYYSISEISIEGRCVCNGHADECSLTDDGRMACHCLHNTCGERCQFCCEGYSRDDNGDCEGRPKNISTGNSTKTTLAQTIGVPRYVEEKERSPKVISTTDNSLNRTALRTTAEAISGSSTVKSTAVLSTKEIRAGTSTLSIPHDLSTVSMPSTENVAMTLIPTRERRLSEPASMHTALENLTRSTTMKVITDSTTVETDTETTIMADITESTRVEITTKPTIVERTTRLTAMEVTLVPTTLETTTVLTTVETTPVPTTVKTSVMSTPVESTAMSTTVKTTTLFTTVETAIMPTTVETTDMPTTVKTTIMPTTVERITEPTKVETSTVPISVKTTSEPAYLERTTESSFVERTTESTTMEASVVFTTKESTTMPTTVETTTTESSTVETTTESSVVETTTSSTVESTTETSTKQNTTESSIVDATTESSAVNITASFTVETTASSTMDITESSTVGTITLSSTVETTSESSTKETTTESSTVDTNVSSTVETTVSSSVETTASSTVDTTESSTVETTTESSTVDNNESSTMETTTESSTVDTAASSTVESTTESSTKENTTESSIVDATTESSTVNITASSTVETTASSTMDITDTVETTTMPTTVETTTAPPPTVPTKVETITVPTTGKTIKVPTTGETKNLPITVPTTVETTTESTTVEPTTMPNTMETTTVSTTTETTTIPTTVETTTVPTTVKTTKVPTTVQTTTVPTAVKTTTVLTTVKTVPTTPRVLSEEELRKIFDFPPGVCYCSRFATVTRQCFPTALNKPCICRANFAGTRCESVPVDMALEESDAISVLLDIITFLTVSGARVRLGDMALVMNLVNASVMKGMPGYNATAVQTATMASLTVERVVVTPLGRTADSVTIQPGSVPVSPTFEEVNATAVKKTWWAFLRVSSVTVMQMEPACKCDPGGSVGKSCVKHLGNCQCISGVRGKKCDRATYFPTLYHTYAELERAVLTSNTKIRVPIAADDGVFPSFSGVGYAFFPPFKEYAVVVQIPKTSKYHVIFHYALRNNQPTSANVELYPRASLLKSYSFEVQFPPRKPSDQRAKNLRLTVNKRGVNREFELDEGAWTVAVTSHSTMLLLDYIVFLPQDYYNADLLKDVQPGPCMLRTSKSEHCDMYTYYDPKSPSVSVSGSLAYTHPFRRQAYLFTDALYFLDEPKLSNMALLGESQPILGFDITVPESGAYVVMVTYVHPERFIHRVFITVGDQRGTMEILPCRYQFLCRQFAMDGNKRPKTYEFMARQTSKVTIESSASAKIGVMTSIFNGAVKAFVSYRIIIHYRQSNSLSKKVEEISIAGHEKPNIPVTFHYCPADPGCRVVVGEEEALSFLFNRGIFTATIQHERGTQLSYMLLVPENVYSTSLLELQSSDKVAEFLQNCGKDHFHVHPVRGRQCRQDVFSLTMRFLGGPSRCMCNVIGSRSPVCEEFGGQCLCRANVVGRKCDRCKLGHSGFPRCRPCACNTRGSLSTFCRSRDGQCQCRRNFNGKKCNECRIGYYDFPSCKKCNCEAAGIKLLPGEKNGCGSVNNTNCRCKDNVMGDKCDSCKPFHFNLHINNPLGCQSCGCNTNGTLGSIKTCHETTGQCSCKSHVIGRHCDQCKDGYYSIEGPNAFGCKRCSCNAGGSISPSCNEITGKCPCLPGIGGNQCDRVTSNDYYYPTLHQYKIELEDAVSTDSDRSAYFRYDESEFPGFSWRGYAVFSQSQKSVYAMITVPRTSKYQLVFYYLLSRYATVTALVRFTPTLNSAPFPSGSATEQRLDVRFRATSNWFYHSADFLVVRDTWGDAQQIMLSQGKWKFTMSASATDLFVDYMVLLPEEYYKPKNLVVNDFSPCKISGDDSHCSHFAFLSLKQDGFVTIQAEDSSVVGGVLRNRRVTDIPFHGRILTGSRNVMSFRLPSKVQNQFVLLASYFHNSDNEGISAVVVKTGSEILRAQMRILSCRYRFGCRQVAIDKNHGVAIFTASQNEETSISMTTSLTIALDFITAVPLAEWTQKLLLPAAQCISNGFSCIQSAYFTPKDAVKIEAEGKLNGGDRAPYYIMDRRARLKHLKVGEKTVHINGKAPTGRYYVIVHFYQPNFLSFLGKVVISGQNAASTLLTFHYCPHVSGCRAIGTSQYREGMRESIYVGRQNDILVSIAIPEDKGVWIDYVLLVPISSFSPSLLDVKPIDITQDFIQDCGQRSFFLKESTSQFCLRSAFILTTRFNGGALSCNCDSLGAIKTGCQPFGGQCVCRPNVIGRACDRCRSGYSGFPFCRRLKKFQAMVKQIYLYLQ
ncbi:Laminin subunit alpha [Stylophora pistillata]|uniref:Laminin subunit alpha n=1 Tax=Stylophora pistillata TaxID=50429 RepID=A0A2B4SDE5_STYPI|nr:Laminin subunit alpha [Stylophora pistillata]